MEKPIKKNWLSKLSIEDVAVGGVIAYQANMSSWFERMNNHLGTENSPTLL